LGHILLRTSLVHSKTSRQHLCELHTCPAGIQVIVGLPDNAFKWSDKTFHIGPSSIEQDQSKIRSCDMCRGCKQLLQPMPKGDPSSWDWTIAELLLPVYRANFKAVTCAGAASSCCNQCQKVNWMFDITRTACDDGECFAVRSKCWSKIQLIVYRARPEQGLKLRHVQGLQAAAAANANR
jgi:hypothetical protein